MQIRVGLELADFLLGGKGGPQKTGPGSRGSPEFCRTFGVLKVLQDVSHSKSLLNQSPPKGAGKMVPRENCRKVSKNFLTLFGDF